MKRYLSAGNFHLGLTNDKGITSLQVRDSYESSARSRDQWTAGNSSDPTPAWPPHVQNLAGKEERRRVCYSVGASFPAQ